MPRILLLAATTGYQTRSFAEAARRLNVRVTLATDRCHVLEDPWRDNAIAVRFEDPAASAEALSLALQNNRIDGIACVADRPTVLAALMAERLGLPGHPPSAAAACRDKSHMRRIFADAGLPSPRHTRVPLQNEPTAAPPEIGYPCVLKPLGLSASRGVIRADNPTEFRSAFARIRAILDGLHDAPGLIEQQIQIEQYIPGREFALEGLMTNGVLRALAIFDKPDPLEGPFFEETIYVTPSREPASTQEAIIETTRHAAAALGLFHGPIHAEMRINDAGVFMLEIAARPIGGLCSRALRFRTPEQDLTMLDLTMEELLILHAISAMPEQFEPKSAASGVMMIPVPRAGIYDSVEGIERAMAVPGIDDLIITAKPGERFVPLPEGASYPGFVFASGPNPGFVENALRTAHAALRFRVLTALDVIK